MKHLSWPGRVSFVLLLAVYGVLTYWLIWPYTPIEIHKITIKEPVYIGGDLSYEVSYSKAESYPVIQVTRQIIYVDGAVVVLAPGVGSRLPTGDYRVQVKVKIPKFISDGMCVFQLTAQYKVNPVRSVTVEATSDPFKLLLRESND